MEVVIKGEPQEIAALVAALQKRQVSVVNVTQRVSVADVTRRIAEGLLSQLSPADYSK